VRYADFSSEALIRACAGSHDEFAWTEFIRRFQPVIGAAVLRTARHWFEPSRSQVDDLVQDTYLKLCESDGRLLRSFQPLREDSIYGFLKVVANNVVHDHFKSAMAAKRGASVTDPIGIPAQREPISDSDSFSIVSRRIQLDQIDRILRSVAAGKDQEKKRTIFWLRHRQGLTAAEIASIPSIGLTTEGVESVLMRLAIQIRAHTASSPPHREVKVRPRQNRSKRLRT
jgi:RNA polymerase sigma-70 factor (ECF subfamily)